jgi:amino acid adenylation domain-containing protein
MCDAGTDLYGEQPVAVVAMAGRFPRAGGVDALWRNLRDGVSGLTELTDAELRASGVPAELLGHPRYVRVAGVVEGVELFDRAFFGMSPREAALLNPEHRLLLELAWEAMEAGGHAPGDPVERVGVFTAAGTNGYWRNLASHPGLDGDDLPLGNDPQFAATRVSYRLGLSGPSLNVQTACSSSLVAVHLACQSLLTGECDLALAGGASIAVPQAAGYLYEPGGIYSPDGVCRAFDAEARGTAEGSGAAMVLLRRLRDALADGDPVLAVIRGSAVNNDGARKASFSAPARDGQSRAVAEALALAGVHPDSVTYVEGHGSGTELGDPVEVQALTDAFRASTDRTGFCALGTVKSAIGHLGTASGVAGLVKAVLALRHGEIPPALHFARPNPRIDFAASPFFVNTARVPWPRNGAPRVAGVSSFGIGGTNAHVVVQEAPAPAPSGPSRPWQLLVLSAATPAALEAATEGLAAHLEGASAEALADAAHTLRVGRRRLPYRRALVCRTPEDAAAALRARDAARLREGAGGREGRPVTLLFPGLGDQYPGMARGLYDAEPAFRAEVDRCAALLAPHLGTDVRTALFPAGAGAEGREEGAGGVNLRRMLGGAAVEGPLAGTAAAHAALFVVEYALARLWMSWGVHPAVLAGHSLGEWAAAAVAGVFSLEDALALVVHRARLVEGLPAGAMLAVPLSPRALEPLLGEGAEVAAVNAPELCTVAGTPAAVDRVHAALAARGVACRRVAAGHAFHSAALRPLAAGLEEAVRRAGPRAPRIPFVSSVTGALLTDALAADPAYWAGQLVAAVRFDRAVPALLAAHPDALLLEVGPGNGLGAFAVASGAPEGAVVASLRAAWTRAADPAVLLEAAARLWVGGARLDWHDFVAGEDRRRVPLPTYPWQRERCWVDRRVDAPAPDTVEAASPAPRRGWVRVAPRRRRAAGNARPAAPPAVAPASFRKPRPALSIPHRPPGSETEAAVAEIWGELLGIDGIGAQDDLFSLGGHSLVAVQVASRVQRARGVELSLADVFGAPTVAGMAARIDTLLAAGARAAPARIRRLPRGAPLALSHQQERVWMAQQEDPCAPMYNVTGALRVRGLRDLGAARRGLAEVVRRHEILRTAYRVQDGVPVQVPLEGVRVPLPVADLTGLAPAAREAQVHRLAALEASRPMRLEEGEVLRAHLLRTGDEDWVLLATVHHIAIDVWSWDVLYREWELLYGAFSRGEPSPLPELTAQYADWAGWQRERLTDEEMARQLDYWREHLRGAPAVLHLPADRPRARERRHAGRRLPVRLAPGARRHIEALGVREGVTVYMVLLAALQALLHRYSGQDDLVVGTLESNRTPPEAEALIGYFLNTFPVRSRPAPGATFRDLLRGARDATLAAHRNADLPMERLLEALRPERVPGYHPLFQVLFTIALPVRLGPRDEAAGLHAGSLHGAGESVIVDAGTSKWDLTLVMAVHGDDVSGALQYDSDLFDAATVERMALHYARIVEAMVEDPDRRLRDLPLLSGDELRDALHASRGPLAELPREGGIHHLFQAQARRAPEAVALVHGTERVTYGELDGQANRLANHLRARGVGPEVRVAVFLERGPAAVLAMLAILGAGGAYVPLDASYPAGRLAYMLEDCGARLVVTESRLLDRLPAVEVERVVLDDDAPRIGAHSATPPDVEVTPDNLVYVFYTSGSTGRPKGVLTPHQGVMSYFAFLAAEYGIGPADTVLQLASLSFDASIRDTLGPLSAGARLVLPSAEEAADPARLLHLARAHGVTAMMSAVPSSLRAMLRAAGDPLPPALRLLLTSGEPLPVDDCRRARAVFGGQVRIVNQWGVTERTMSSTFHSVEPDERGPLAPIGRPGLNTRVYVLDEALHPVPAGVAGEAYIATPGVARGYGGRPALTAERFLPDPFSDEAGGRMYRAGDRVRRRADGVLEYLGRADQQVKVQGVRVEPGEVEAALRTHPAVDAAAVAAWEDGAGEHRLAAYVVAADGVADAALRAHLAGLLPPALIPARFVRLEALPLLPNGKLDRRALPAPDGEEGERGGYVAPRTPVEALLSAVWAEVLGAERVGADDDFFALGGHSLLAMRVGARVREALGVDLPVRALFEDGTVARLAARIDALRADPAPPLVPLPRDRPLPLSPGQERLWLLHRLDPGDTSYVMPFPIRLLGPLDVRALERSVAEVVRRHEVLRTRVAVVDGEPVQVAAPAGDLPIARVDLSRLAPGDRERELVRLVEAEAARPFDLAAAPPLRLFLARLGPAAHAPILMLHHFASDAWSMRVLVHEISVLYGAFTAGRPSPLPALPVQYADYAAWQRARMTEERVAADLAWWRERLRGARPVALPGDFAPPAHPTGAAGVCTRDISDEVARGLDALARAERSTPFMVMLAAFAVLLLRHGGHDDVVIGSPAANRGHPATQGLIGFFVSMMPLRLRLAGNPTFRSLVRQAREATSGALEHAEFPFERLAHEMGVERRSGRPALLQVTLDVETQFRRGLQIPGVTLQRVEFGIRRAKFDLELKVQPEEQGRCLMMVYAAERMAPSTVERMLEDLCALVAHAAADPDTRVLDLALAGEAFATAAATAAEADFDF